MPKPKPLRVIFRADQTGPHAGEVTAVFPSLVGTNSPSTFTTYAHVGQHGAAGLGWYGETRPAHPEEYKDLWDELRGIYETDPPGDCLPVKLVLAQRMSARDYYARRDQLKRHA